MLEKVQQKVGTKNRGFASMDPQKQREIASKGGKAAHLAGTAHEFTPEEAREAGRKGGQASGGARRAQRAALLNANGNSSVRELTRRENAPVVNQPISEAAISSDSEIENPKRLDEERQAS